MPKSEPAAEKLVRKPELIERVAKATKQPKKAVTEIVDAALETITGALKKGEKVQFVGFGTFEVKSRAARVGVNPQTGEKIKVRATKVPAFKAGAQLKQAVSTRRKSTKK